MPSSSNFGRQPPHAWSADPGGYRHLLNRRTGGEEEILFDRKENDLQAWGGCPPPALLRGADGVGALTGGVGEYGGFDLLQHCVARRQEGGAMHRRDGIAGRLAAPFGDGV